MNYIFTRQISLINEESDLNYRDACFKYRPKYSLSRQVSRDFLLTLKANARIVVSDQTTTASFHIIFSSMITNYSIISHYAFSSSVLKNDKEYIFNFLNPLFINYITGMCVCQVHVTFIRLHQCSPNVFAR